ncbi:hypothetical protein KPL74_13225 [Bacillus sp. NP157]|nr:hypothetical protein KPL74_13225 [Bacillus sp. NP157]
MIPAIGDKAARAVAVIVAAGILTLLLAGMVRHYDPVPFFDAWDGDVGFYLRLGQGDGSAWWGFHNEHRIVLTRLLFYADNAWAGGVGIVPLCANVVLAAAMAGVFMVCIGTLTRRWARCERLPWMALVVGLGAFWSQAQNFTWAFQPQFFLACLLPLAACHAIAQASASAHRLGWFTAACGFGVLALGSMANGVLALPMVAVLATCFGFERRYIMVAALLAVMGLATARLGYPPGGSMPAFPWRHPVGLAEFVALYLGSPLGAMFEVSHASLLIAALAGTSLVAAVLVASARAWRTRATEPMRLALVVFTAYVLASALATAIGRFDLGPVSAMSGRYSTPVLAAWSAVTIALLPAAAPGRAVAWLPASCLVALLPMQATSLHRDGASLHARSLAALAIELQVDDPTTLQSVYPRPADVLATGQAASKARLGVFGRWPLDGLSATMGAHVPRDACLGRVMAMHGLPGTLLTRFSVAGDGATAALPAAVVLADSQGTIVGAALRVPEGTTSTVDYDGYLPGPSTLAQGPANACQPPTDR